ncbi:Mac domain containing protein [Pyrenophora tritici-repentis]|nr:Mac domain containing protein [Pyrenophora tritici-repentis]
MVLHYLVNRKGVDVLVYVNGTTPTVYSLTMKRNNMQATISLECSLHVRGFDDVEQTFTIDYGADDLMPGTDLIDLVNLEDSEYTLPSLGHLQRITRPGASADLKILRLKIRKPCPIWCPPSTGRIAPKHDSDAAFTHLSQLAQSTMVHVLFDYTWVHVNNRPMLKDIFDDEQRKAFSTLPKSPVFEEQHRKEKWTVFSPVDPPAAAPPPYTNKRPRSPNTSSPVSGAPYQKRVHSFFDITGSPTEKATTASSPSSCSPHPDDYPSALNTSPTPRSPYATDNLSAPKTSPPPRYSRPINNPPTIQNIKDLVKDAANEATQGWLKGFKDTLNVATEDRLARFFEEMADHVEQECKQAGFELADTLEDHETNILIVKEDQLADFHRVLEDVMVTIKGKIDEFKETIEELKDAAELDIAYSTAHFQRRYRPAQYRQSLKDTWKLLAEEEAVYNKEEALIEDEQAIIDDQRRVLARKRRLVASRRKLIQRKRKLLECEQNQGPAPQQARCIPARALKTEKEKMLDGESFFQYDEQLVAERAQCTGAIYNFNSTANPSVVVTWGD